MTWAEHMPRVDPEHFSVTELTAILQVAARPAPGYPAIEFVWLDVACIDQTPGSPVYYSEIGRQATIFRRALDVFVWLTTLSSAHLDTWARELDALLDWRANDRFKQNTAKRLAVDLTSAICGRLDRRGRYVEELGRYPWFSSLWTLQEAFLCPGAVFLGRDGMAEAMRKSMSYQAGEEKRDFYTCILRDFVRACHILQSDAHTDIMEFPENKQANMSAKALQASIAKLGITDNVARQTEFDFVNTQSNEVHKVIPGNPLSLLAGSSSRITKYPCGRIYGIMQVFGLKLGNASPDVDHRTYSVEELQDQLGVR